MDITNIYLKELKNEHSTNDETLRLLALANDGCKKSREQIIKNHLLLVVKKAREYMNKGVPLGDLISEGNAGLCVAITKYEPEKGTFASYAQYWIKQSIIRNCMHNNRLVKLPENVSELLRTDRWAGEKYSEFSIDLPNEDGNTLADSIEDKGNVDLTSLNEEEYLLKLKIEKILSFLKDRDAEVVKACYGIGTGDPMEIEEVAELFNLTPTRINQILRTSLKQMRIGFTEKSEIKPKDIEIISASYGYEDDKVDVTDKVTDLFLKKENIKSSNRLGGDPCPGFKKFLYITYICDGELTSKTFQEGLIVKF